MYVFDISWVDQGSQTYYLADRSNAVIDIVDAKTDTLLAQLSGGFKGFTGNNGTSGPDGVTTGGHCLFVTDAPSRVVSFDTSSFPPALVSAVSTASGDHIFVPLGANNVYPGCLTGCIAVYSRPTKAE